MKNVDRLACIEHTMMAITHTQTYIARRGEVRRCDSNNDVNIPGLSLSHSHIII